MLAAVKLREHYSLYVASVEGVPQDPLVSPNLHHHRVFTPRTAGVDVNRT
jgi:hypothetical protein